jgi:hypothetical protein
MLMGTAACSRTEERRAVVSIRVDPSKAGGTSWDSDPEGAPDIAFCLAYAGTRTCYRGSPGAEEALCENAYTCTLPRVKVPVAGAFEIVVLDIDLPVNELVGREVCFFGKKCRVGSSDVFVGDAPHDW